MSKPWFLANPALGQKLQREIEAEYPDLRFECDGEAAFLRGFFPVVHEGQELDRYQIEVRIPGDYPTSLPSLKEVGGRIPHDLDHHVLPSTGEACLFVPEEWLLAAGPNAGLPELLAGRVRNYFIGQSLVEAGKSWPFGERSHGKKGALEAYGEWFGTEDEDTIRRYLECLSRNGLKGHWECPCGSGKKIRKCHREQLGVLRRRIPRLLAAKALERLRNIEALEKAFAAQQRELEHTSQR